MNSTKGVKMPYIKQDKRKDMDEIVELMLNNESLYGNFKHLLWMHCSETVEPSYNNYKNYIGELNECASEIIRRLIPYNECKDEIEFNISECFHTIDEYADENNVLQLLDILKLMKRKKIVANGDLNYILYKYCKESYPDEDLVDAVITFIDELRTAAFFIRRELLAPYEDEKIIENGDVT